MTKEYIYRALKDKALFEVVQQSENSNQLRLSGRCPPTSWNSWLLVIYHLLRTAAAGSPWSCDVSKHYILKGERVVYAWRLIFQAEHVSKYYQDIAGSIMQAPNASRVEVQEQLLPGHKPGVMRGGVNAKGKGTSAGGSAPMILSRGRP